MDEEQSVLDELTEQPIDDPYTIASQEAAAELAQVDPIQPEKLTTIDFIGDAEAVLATAQNADEGIKDLVEAYKSGDWENPQEVLLQVREYADALRSKTPGEENLLSPQETLEIAPVKPGEVDDYIQEW